MSKISDNDDSLVGFLRTHAIAPPPAAPDFEEKLMQSVASIPVPQTSRSRNLWVLPPAIAASLLISLVGYRLFVSPTPKVDTRTLEAFIEDSWDGSTTETSSESDSLLFQLAANN